MLKLSWSNLKKIKEIRITSTSNQKAWAYEKTGIITIGVFDKSDKFFNEMASSFPHEIIVKTLLVILLHEIGHIIYGPDEYLADSFMNIHVKESLGIQLDINRLASFKSIATSIMLEGESNDISTKRSN